MSPGRHSGSCIFGSVVRLDWDEKPKQWLLTAFRKEGDGAVPAGSTDFDKGPGGPADSATAGGSQPSLPLGAEEAKQQPGFDDDEPKAPEPPPEKQTGPVTYGMGLGSMEP